MTAQPKPASEETPKQDTGSGAESAAPTGQKSTPEGGKDVSADLAKTLEERTADLQRVTAEYHNYRKRVERDKAAAADAVTASVVAGLLPVLDDIDRARDHDDLVGPFGTVAESLISALTKLGLEVFGTKGDPFDPVVHEAVAHMHSAEVTEASCIDVLRRGYRIGDRLLRPAMVAVAEPEPEPAAAADKPTEEAKPEAEPEVVEAEVVAEDKAAEAPADEAETETAAAEEADEAETDGSESETAEAESDNQSAAKPKK